jgi:hypothetical protein
MRCPCAAKGEGRSIGGTAFTLFPYSTWVSFELARRSRVFTPAYPIVDRNEAMADGDVRNRSVKLAGDPNNPARFKDDATADELRAEIMRRLAVLHEAGLIDLQALPAPSDGIVKRPKRSADHAGINGE